MIVNKVIVKEPSEIALCKIWLLYVLKLMLVLFKLHFRKEPFTLYNADVPWANQNFAVFDHKQFEPDGKYEIIFVFECN